MSAPSVAVTATIADTEIEVLESRITERILERLQGQLPSPWMSPDQAADYLGGWPRKRIYNLVSEGGIPHRKQGGKLLFNRYELDAWLDDFYRGPIEFEPLHDQAKGPSLQLVTNNAPAALDTPRGRTQEAKSRVEC